MTKFTILMSLYCLFSYKEQVKTKLVLTTSSFLLMIDYFESQVIV